MGTKKRRRTFSEEYKRDAVKRAQTADLGRIRTTNKGLLALALASHFPRPLKLDELRLLRWCAHRMQGGDCCALQSQLSMCMVTSDDDDGMSFEVDVIAPEVTVQGIDLSYDDNDGTSIFFIISFVHGILSWVDRSRVDNLKPIKRLPTPAEVISYNLSVS